MKKLSLEKLEARYLDCQSCALKKHRRQIVFGEGKITARYMLVGEGPGADEDRTGVPFVGKAGKRLRRLLYTEMKLPPELFYITNVVLCRPRNNRDPRQLEATACRARLISQIFTVQPDTIFALGKIAANWLLFNTVEKRKMDAIGRLISKYQRGNMPERFERNFRFADRDLLVNIAPNFHPSYLDRTGGAYDQTFMDVIEQGINLTRGMNR